MGSRTHGIHDDPDINFVATNSKLSNLVDSGFSAVSCISGG